MIFVLIVYGKGKVIKVIGGFYVICMFLFFSNLIKY